MNWLKESFVYLPSPSNISYMWGFGFLLGVTMLMQIMTGIFLALHYSPLVEWAFSSWSHILHNVTAGWEIQLCHFNGASLFFILIYLHIGRGLYFNSSQKSLVWHTGLILLFLLMMTAFLGYVLPWGQMSYWGATVITNLFSAIPYIGTSLVQWMWGGFAVGEATLHRFFVFHFVFPFIMLGVMMMHLLVLHESGSFNPLGLNSQWDKSPFTPYFFMKDVASMIMMLLFFSCILFLYPYWFSDPENFMMANSLVTPIHIQPEWYYLFAYAILRAIPNKLGGVMALMGSIFILSLAAWFTKNNLSNKFNPFNKLLFWVMTSVFFMLTWLGAQPVEDPYILLSQEMSLFYFIIILILFLS